MRFNIKSVPVSALCLLAFSFAFCVGCGPKKPEGVPDLHPTTVKIVKAGTPVANANVFFVSEGTSGSWSVTGVTDDAGVATIQTSQGDWKAPGAPEGSFKIYITKLAKFVEPPKPASDDEEAKAAYYAERLKLLEEAAKEIPEAMKSADTSGLTITVAAKTGANETFDIGEAE